MHTILCDSTHLEHPNLACPLFLGNGVTLPKLLSNSNIEAEKRDFRAHEFVGRLIIEIQTREVACTI